MARPGRRRPGTLVRRALLGLGWTAAVALLGILPATNCTTVRVSCTDDRECGRDFICQGSQCTFGCRDTADASSKCSLETECRSNDNGQLQCQSIICTGVNDCPNETTCWPPTGPAVCTSAAAVACDGSAEAPACSIGTCPDGQLCRVIAVQSGDGIEQACGCVPGIAGGE